MKRFITALTALIVVQSILTPPTSAGGSCSSNAKIVKGTIISGATCRTQPSSNPAAGKTPANGGGGVGQPIRSIRPLTPEQRAFNDANNVACFAVMSAGGTCPQPDPPPAQTAVAAPAPRPQLTRGMIVAAFRRIPVPKERSVAQPGNKTLVNFDTIFYTRAEGFQRTVTLVGQQVTLDIAPVSYTWHPGDGTSFTTTSPGGPYPNKSVTHRYEDAHVTVAHHVNVNWGARFRVNGGAWADIAGTVTSVGPATDLRVAEATPVLKGVATRS